MCCNKIYTDAILLFNTSNQGNLILINCALVLTQTSYIIHN